MKTSFLIISMFITQQLMIFDFSKNSSLNNWYITNDNVMGGISTSTITINSEGNGVFTGTVSTENNGGFAMTRLQTDVNVPDTVSKIVLRVKGDGKKYQFRIKSKKFQRYWYVQSFTTTTSWETIELPLKDFYPSFRGYRLNKENFSGNTIKELAILVGNKQNEAFTIVLDYIKLG